MQTSSNVLVAIGVLAIAGTVLGAVSISSQAKFQKEVRSYMSQNAPADANRAPVAPSQPSAAAPSSAQQTALTEAQAKVLVTMAWKLELNPSEGPKPVVSVDRNDNGTYKVTAVVPAMDDSISNNRYEGVATYSNGNWVLSSPSKTWSCAPNRGHQDYSTVACL